MSALFKINYVWMEPNHITGDPDEIDLIESIIAIDLDLQTVLHSTRGLDFNSNTGKSDLGI